MRLQLLLFVLLGLPFGAQAAATDDYAQYATGLDTPYRHAASVSPSDSVDLTNVTRGIFVGGAGNLVVITEGGETVTITGVTAGTILRLCAGRVKNTGTTATNIVALW